MVGVVPEQLDPHLERWNTEEFVAFCRKRFSDSSMREAAAALGLSSTAYDAFLHGNRMPNLTTYCNLCAAAGKPLGWCLNAT